MQRPASHRAVLSVECLEGRLAPTSLLRLGALQGAIQGAMAGGASPPVQLASDTSTSYEGSYLHLEITYTKIS